MELLEEMARGMGAAADDSTFMAILTQTCGAIAMAEACASDDMRASILGAAAQQIRNSIEDLAVPDGSQSAYKSA